MTDANIVNNRVIEAFEAWGSETSDVALYGKLRDLAQKQAVLPAQAHVHFFKGAVVGSPLIKLLIDNHAIFIRMIGISRVLYGPSSTGKTAALRNFCSCVDDFGSFIPRLRVHGHGCFRP